ncbi:MAG TPA: anti-sigma factor [Solirubrobacter sp.]|nr:anti-sigma factor [Solirubrobacter sp.]
MSEHERFEDAAGAYVLGALPDEERAAYAAHLATCATCQAEVQELQVAAEALPASAPPMKPPDALKARIMAEVEREAALLASATEPRREVKRPRWRLRWPTGAVAALACAALLVGLGAGALVFGGAGGETFRFKPDPSLPQASATLEMTGDGATIVADKLPAPPSGKTYMVWLVREGESAPQPTSALFTPRSDGTATASVAGDMDGVDAVLVNTEPLGGSQEPTSPALLTATLS